MPDETATIDEQGEFIVPAPKPATSHVSYGAEVLARADKDRSEPAAHRAD